ncbi:MAG: EAL domain-containing protein [Rhodospirillales bacterium]|nr:EAL domain-containing protein [Rhodospirillales bacterium]
MRSTVIVDDSPANLAIYARLVESVDPEAGVRAFPDPFRALDFLNENLADLVITDYLMPALHGAELTRRIRGLPNTADAPVMVVTAHADRAFRREAFEAGASDFVQSPIDHAEFRMRVRNLLKLGGHQRLIRERAFALERELKETAESRDQVLRDSRERLAQVIDTVPAMISAADTAGRQIFVNAYRAALLGERPTRLEEDGERLDRQVLATGQGISGYEEEIVLPGGERRTFLTSKSPLRDGAGRIEGVLSMSLDISERKRAEALLEFQARHDDLTSLPNRAYLFHTMRQALAASAATGRMRPLALHFIDLDRFKHINDGLGHHIGDRLLRAVAGRLQDAVRGSDMVARLGGDEFAVLQDDAGNPDDVAQMAERLNQVLIQPFDIDGREMVISASIGVTLFPGDGEDPEELLRNADLAMYRIKERGRNGYQFFVPDMLAHARSELQLAEALRVALAREEFTLRYQPQIDLRSGRIVGAEALVRWQSGDQLVSPGVFLPAAAENGLMAEIDDWVLRAACRQARLWRDRDGRGICVSVNVSVPHARTGGLRSRVVRALEESGLPPEHLELELTEGVLLEETHQAAEDLEAVHRMGVRLSIDDFGTGFSSLGRLATLRADRLKIDKSFIDTLDVSNNLAIVRAIVGLGRALRIEVVAEGVETARQLDLIRGAGCDVVQGYFTGRPMAAEAFEEVLDGGRVLPDLGTRQG